ncbi:MAG: YcxB family protein [Chitinophagaceae bacterium]|nr:YcxB family protein [Chitinophagaceae bacterium]
MLSLKFNLTEEEYFEYNYYTAWSAPHKKAYRIRYYVRVLALYSVIAGLYIFTNHSHRLEIDLIIFAVIGIIYFLLVPILIRNSTRRRTKQIIAEPENQHVLDESEIILTDTGIVDQDHVSQSKYDWDAIVKKTETRNSYYLYTNSYHAIVIPKRVINNDQEQKELERLFNRFLSLSSEFSE